MISSYRGKSLATTFILFALAIVVPFAMLMGGVTKLYIDSEQARLTSIGKLSSNRLRENVDRYFAEMSATASTLARFADVNSDNLGTFDAQVRAVAKASGYTAGLLTLEGRHLINSLVAPGKPLPFKPRPVVADALVRTKLPFVSNVMVGATVGDTVISVSAPVMRDDTVTGIFSVVSKIGRFEQVVADAQIHAPYYAFVLDKAGQVVAHTPGAPLDGKKERYAQAQPGEASGDPAGKIAQADTIEFPDRSALSGWTIVTGMPKSALEAPLHQSLALLGVATALFLGLGGLVATRIAHGAADTAGQLADAATRIARGERVAVASSPIREADIVGRALASASNEIADQRAALARSREELETRVRDRTRELEESRTRYQVLADNVSDVIVTWRRGDVAFSYVSPSCRATFGSEAEAIRMLGPAGLLHAEDESVFTMIDEALGAGRDRVTRQFRARRRGGTSIWIESVSSLVSAVDPSEANVISVLRDITDRKNQSEALRIARDTAELAQAKAENANRSKSEFLALVSHEIRTSLATVKGYAELMSDTEPLNDEQTQYITLIESAAAIMLASVDDIVDFAEGETGVIRLDLHPFALIPALETVLAFLKPAAARRGVSVGLTLDPGLPDTVYGDERRLRQVLLNLTTAILRSRRGALIDVSVRRDRTSAEQDRIGVTISSTGGFATGHEHGRLGLAIAQRLIRLMDGSLEVVTGTAELSRCRFTCRLPAAQVQGGADPSAPTARILVVEEHVINQDAARTLLERAGYAVDVVGDGAAAIAAVQRGAYDLVLLSIQLPGIDGLATARRIRTLVHPAGDVPIVAMSASVMPNGMRAILDAGINGHVPKPLVRDRLIAAVQAHLSSFALVEMAPSGPETSLPTVFDRPSYDRLVERVGIQAARNAARRFVALLAEAHAEEAAIADQSTRLAEAARELGFLDLAAAHESLAAASDLRDLEAAIRRCRIARDLVLRVFEELEVGETGAVARSAMLH